jgi:hypothetical protein
VTGSTAALRGGSTAHMARPRSWDRSDPHRAAIPGSFCAAETFKRVAWLARSTRTASRGSSIGSDPSEVACGPADADRQAQKARQTATLQSRNWANRRCAATCGARPAFVLARATTSRLALFRQRSR